MATTNKCNPEPCAGLKALSGIFVFVLMAYALVTTISIQKIKENSETREQFVIVRENTAQSIRQLQKDVADTVATLDKVKTDVGYLRLRYEIDNHEKLKKSSVVSMRKIEKEEL